MNRKAVLLFLAIAAVIGVFFVALAYGEACLDCTYEAEEILETNCQTSSDEWVIERLRCSPNGFHVARMTARCCTGRGAVCASWSI